MRHVPARRAPLWFVVLTAAVCAVILRELVPAWLSSGHAGTTDTSPQLAFWWWVVALAEALWKGAEVAGRVALAILQYSVHWAWRAIVLLGKGASELGKYAWQGAKKTWQLLRATYDHVLKPAWQKLSHWIDRVRKWLDKYVRPVYNLVVWLRERVLEFYARYIRPWLDIIDVSRRFLRLLGTFGLEWAKKLDAKLGTIESFIDTQFQRVLGALNEVITIVNRVLTADGLFQRLAFLKTLQRDWNLAWKTMVAGYAKPVTAADRADADTKVAAKTQQQVFSDVRAYMRDKAGPDAGLFSEMAAQWRKQLQGK